MEIKKKNGLETPNASFMKHNEKKILMRTLSAVLLKPKIIYIKSI